MEINLSDSDKFLIKLIAGAILVSFAPFVSIWCLNTLFEVTIAYSWQNWFALVVLILSVFGLLTTFKMK